MESALYDCRRILVIRLDEGEDLIEGIGSAAEKHGVDGGVIVSLTGAVVDPKIINPGGMGDEPEPVETQLEGKMEVDGGGNIALDDDERTVVHVHASFGPSPNKSYTGHLVSAKVKYFVEAVIAVLDRPMVRRVNLFGTKVLVLE
ncbi:MAG: DUF296 domain-containing protein [Candidatus Altiarchaeales archaeon]|nr:DUF296 domain-containing protein [Candidatus Altiarchaeales archaeon]